LQEVQIEIAKPIYNRRFWMKSGRVNQRHLRNESSVILQDLFELDLNLDTETGHVNERADISSEPDVTVKVENRSSLLPSRGNIVRLENGLIGTVKYVGLSHVTQNEVIGVELDSWNVIGNNGSLGDKQYFHALPGFGHFTTRDAVIEIITSKKDKVQESFHAVLKAKLTTISNLCQELNHMKQMTKLICDELAS